MKIKVFTAFSGYDSQCMALDMVKENHPDFDYELVGWSEIDKYACQMHDVFYPQWSERNYGDISKTQVYKMAGNSIVVHQLHAIFEQMFYPIPQRGEQLTLFQ